MIVDSTIYLEHFGKKGMRWGQRSQSTKTSGANKPSRKERKKLVKQEKLRLGQQKAEALMKTAAKDKNVLILLNGRQIVTGQEFTQHMIQGGLLNVNTSRIYAQQKSPKGQYVLA